MPWRTPPAKDLRCDRVRNAILGKQGLRECARDEVGGPGSGGWEGVPTKEAGFAGEGLDMDDWMIRCKRSQDIPSTEYVLDCRALGPRECTRTSQSSWLSTDYGIVWRTVK